MIQRDALIMKNHILAPQKFNFKTEIFSSEIEVKKNFLRLENRIG